LHKSERGEGEEAEETMAKMSPFAGYRGGEEMPLGGYAALVGLYHLGLAGFFSVARWRRWELPSRIGFGDLLLLGVATHKLTRIVTKDWVTAPLRAPFTEYQGPSIHGEVNERSRGTGMRRATGDLLTCQYCTGPWIAGALSCALAVQPRATRLLAGIFAATAISDFLHRAYEAASSKSEASLRAGEQQSEGKRQNR
jgi:hypothetical protein